MIIKYCIIHDNFFPVEHDAQGNEGHVVFYGSMFDNFGDEPCIDFCDFPLCESEPPDNLTDEEWEYLFSQESYIPELIVLDNEYEDYEY